MNTSDETQSNGTNMVLNAVPTPDDALKPFEPYIKRFGFGYVHFKNGTGLLAKEFGAIAKEIWDKSPTDYNKNVDEWCQVKRQATDVYTLVPAVLDEIIEYIESTEEISDGKWGSCRGLKELIRDKQMPELYDKLIALRNGR